MESHHSKHFYLEKQTFFAGNVHLLVEMDTAATMVFLNAVLYQDIVVAVNGEIITDFLYSI